MKFCLITGDNRIADEVGDAELGDGIKRLGENATR